MRWESGRRSDNVEDRRGMSVGRGVAGGGIGVVVIALIAMFLGIDPSIVLNQAGNLAPTEQSAAPRQPSPEEDKLADFISVVLADTEDTWTTLFRQDGAQYAKPKLVLFSGAVESACGHAQAAMGPFYCPADSKVYLDLSFFNDLAKRHDAPGDFAQAYVVAHEVGHHVQNLLGIAEKVHAASERMSEEQANKMQVRMELQADCLAGVWTHHAQKQRQILEQGDLEEALGAAAAVGDDRLQRQGRGYVVPESFTHGSSAQRAKWFTAGARSGDLNACNTFKTRNL
jgi:predicted metalloprotease